MAEAAKDQDQSMEDILQSIKRIIAEEGEPVSGAAQSDVLELTELLADDGSVSRIKPEERSAQSIPTMSIDEIMATPIAPEPEPEPEPVMAPPEPEPVSSPEPIVEAQEESLISGATLSGSVAALNALRDSLAPTAPRPASSGMRSGTTVEELVLEALKPMLKDWLDQHLQQLVETLVQKEISKLAQRS